MPSRATLRSLCLVSKFFNETFSQFLYSSIVFHDGNARILRDPELLGAFTSNTSLRFVKSLAFKLIEGSWAIGNHREVGRLVDAPGYGRMGDVRHWAGMYNDSIIKILSLTPHIFKFEYVLIWNIIHFLANILTDGRIGRYHSLSSKCWKKIALPCEMSRSCTPTWPGSHGLRGFTATGRATSMKRNPR